jgi:uncharacterized protein YqfA (UPF0365 family)
MSLANAVLFAQGGMGGFLFVLVLGIGGIAALVLVIAVIAFIAYGNLWFQAYMSSADVSMLSLIGMGFRQVNSRVIVQAKIMAAQAGLDINRKSGISTQRLESHYLANGNVTNVILAIIAAHRAGIDLDFDRAAAIDLAGRDVLDAVRTSVMPKIIDCPDPRSGKPMLSAVACNGIEMLVKARVTVRTNLTQLIGGATEDTVIARVGQGIVTSIGSSKTHNEVLANPNQISRILLDRGLDAQTAFEIVSIDIANLEPGENVGAKLAADQAASDLRVAQAEAEKRRAAAVAKEQEMQALVQENRAKVVLAEAEIPLAIAGAFKDGRLGVMEYYNMRNIQADTQMRSSIAGQPSDGAR